MKISILSTKNVREKKLANKRHKITRRKEQKKLKKYTKRLTRKHKPAYLMKPEK